MSKQEEINKQGQAYIAGLWAAVHQIWGKMCEEEGIPPGSAFVVFSPDNKYLPYYNRALTTVWEAEAQYRAGGYVGLKIEKRGVKKHAVTNLPRGDNLSPHKRTE
jgi:hypothetical protein